MPLSPGDRVGPYEIVALLGQGGMGEVYRARDPRLQRDVAIKTSAQRFSERFDREARAIAALNHPNICQIYDVGPNYLVMELVEGAPPKGPLGLDELLKIAEQIIAALETAHAKGITHRDLKPGNILIRTDGVVKVLDFGLAKFGGTPTTPVSAGENSPTLSLAMTQAGMILGTAAYMAPEQARGKEVDNRADIWAFGVVIHELLTGDRLFKGEDLTETLASVVKEKPDLSQAPRKLKRLLTACLEKDPAKRLQAIGDARLLLDDAPEPAQEPVPVAAPSRLGLWASVAAGAFAILAGVALWAPWRAAPPEVRSVAFPLLPPGEERFTNQYGAFSVSPDGRHVAFVTQGKGGQSLWLRSIESPTARQVPGVNNINFTFWSPDSKSLAFTAAAEGKLKRVDIAGGAPLTLTELGATDPAVTTTGSWNADGVILVGSAAGLMRVAASGGGATPLTRTDAKAGESGHGYPQFLPDGNRFLYFVSSSDPGVQGIYASSLDQPTQRKQILRTDAKAAYVPPIGDGPGYLLWMQEDNLVAQRFDLEALERQGDPVSVAESVSRNPTNPVRAAFWASDSGALVYLTGAADISRRIVWVDRSGKILSDALPAADLLQPRLAPDGSRVAVQRRDGAAGDIGIWEFARSVATRLTFGSEREEIPLWSPDGKQIAYYWLNRGIYRKDASGVGDPMPILETADPLQPLDWSPDGRYVVYRSIAATTGRDLWGVAVTQAGSGQGSSKPFPIVVGPSNQNTARWSPDAKWLAYTSNESGTNELYIQPFVEPGTDKAGRGGRWQVSNTGAVNPIWRKDGRELYYDTPSGEIMAASVDVEGAGLKIGAPRLLFRSEIETNTLHAFDATGDGQRFLLQTAPAGTGDSTLTVVTNWQAALKK